MSGWIKEMVVPWAEIVKLDHLPLGEDEDQIMGMHGKLNKEIPRCSMYVIFAYINPNIGPVL